MKTGKPIKEARLYTEERRLEENRRIEEKWCKSLFSRNVGFVCSKSPILKVYREICTTTDYEDCPFKSQLGQREDS